MIEETQVAREANKGRNQMAAAVVLGHTIKHILNAALQSLLLPKMKIDIGISGTQFGVLAAARQATGGVTTMYGGYLGDRFAHRAPLLLTLSLAWTGVAFFLAGSAPNYWLIFAAMLLAGVGPSLYHPPAIGILSRRFPDKHGFAIALHGTGGSVGQVWGPIVAWGMLALLSWRGVLQVSLLPALLAAFVIWSMMRNIPGGAGGSTSTKAYFTSLGGLLKNQRLQMLLLMGMLLSMGQNAINTFLPVFLLEDLDFSVRRVAIYLSLSQVVGIGAQPLMGVLSDNFGRKTVLVPAMTVLGLLFIALRFADHGMQLTLTIVAMGAFLYSLHSVIIATAIDVAGGATPSTVGSLSYGASFLGSVSPILAGVFTDRYGVTSAFVYGGVIVLVATVILALLRLPKTPTQMGNRTERAAYSTEIGGLTPNT